MSNTATFTLHVGTISKNARDKMGWVLRVFQSRKLSLMRETLEVSASSLVLTLLKYLVIPLLEYCCQLGNPWNAKDIQAVEAMQRTFTYNIIEA